MKTVLFFTDVHTGAHATEYAGVCECAATYGWRVIEIEYGRTERPAQDFINHWRPAGVIVECGHLGEDLDVAAYSKLPCVFIDPNLSDEQTKGMFVVKQDTVAIASAAYKELSGCAPASYAFVGWAGRQDWSRARGIEFASCVRAGGNICRVFRKRWRRSDFFAFHDNLSQWLPTLPRPAAVFAANDETAEQVVVACSRLGLSCPDDIAVIGADNDILRCEVVSPMMSSLAIDYLGCGHVAADLLAHQLRDGAAAVPETRRYGVLQTVRRTSTRSLSTRDDLVRTVLEHIARDACAGLTSAQVLKSIPWSRRHVEQRFRAAVGHSIGDEIYEVRFQRALQLLSDARFPISRIAGECGWESESFLNRTFKRRMGVSLREWRKSNCGS